ncbi:rRNA maturation RNase YbeY [Candidatus Dojkabacteria bacterium]|jgi:probable rRNA maturation factor|nr:rRNA maturation RNase YbeY [Candidatus Dojkabacteria bacterium]
MKLISIFSYPRSIGISETLLSSKLLLALQTQFEVKPVSIIFVSEKEIQKLNKEYRKVDESTDVLSFNFDKPDLLGEVYICYDYIARTSKDENEVYRVIIHGILHLLGYDHKHEFVDINSKNIENMFIVQESILNNLMKRLK